MEFLRPNEARAFENLNPIEGGDNAYIALNLQRLDGSENGDNAERGRNVAELRSRIESAYRPLWLDAIRRLASKEAKALQRAARKHEGDPAAWRAWRDSFYVDVEGDAYKAFQPILSSVAEQYRAIGSIADERINRVATEAAKRYVRDSLERLGDEPNAPDDWLTGKLNSGNVITLLIGDKDSNHE